MPKVSEAYHQAKRDEIAHAAIRVLQRQGLSNTSIADIVDESGSSAGGIYSHFANKADLARHVARDILGWRIDRLTELASEDAEPTPVQVAEFVLETLSDGMPIDVIIQFWGEATIDAEMREAVKETVAVVRTRVAQTLKPYAVAHSRDADHAAALAETLTDGIVSLCQGYIVSSAIFGHTSPQEYLARFGMLFEGSHSRSE